MSKQCIEIHTVGKQRASAEDNGAYGVYALFMDKEWGTWKFYTTGNAFYYVFPDETFDDDRKDDLVAGIKKAVDAMHPMTVEARLLKSDDEAEEFTRKEGFRELVY